jgi:hypothetical protein
VSEPGHPGGRTPLPTLPPRPSLRMDAALEGGLAREGDATTFLPHVVAWNLTRRCNLSCAHCYIAAGSWHAAAGELSTDRCHEVLDQILEVNPNPMLILA